MSVIPETRWGRLSDETKSILEWVEDIHSEHKNDIYVTLGEPAKLGFPGADSPRRSLKTLVTQKVFDEIKSYVAEQDLTDGDDAMVIEEASSTSFKIMLRSPAAKLAL